MQTNSNSNIIVDALKQEQIVLPNPTNTIKKKPPSKLSLDKFTALLSKIGHTLNVVFSENNKVKFLGCKGTFGHNYVVSIPEKYVVSVKSKKGINAIAIKQIQSLPLQRQSDFVKGLGMDVFVLNSSTILTFLGGVIQVFIQMNTSVLMDTEIESLEREVETCLSIKEEEYCFEEPADSSDEDTDVNFAETAAVSVVVDGMEQSEITLGCAYPLFTITEVLTKTETLNKELEDTFSRIFEQADLFTKQKVDKVIGLIDQLGKQFPKKMDSLFLRVEELQEQQKKLGEMFKSMETESKTIPQDQRSSLKQKISESSSNIFLELFKTKDNIDVILTDYAITLEDLISM